MRVVVVAFYPKAWSATAPATPGRDRRLPRARILRRRPEFLAIRREGGTQSGTQLKLNWRKEPRKSRRMAIVVPKACGNAVVRNRIKRWVREGWRNLQAELAPGSDSVWIARPSAGKAGSEILRLEMIRLYQRAGLWMDAA
ncbi:MAG: ribonuclease P protein component [Verrucomicrobia bacterium]|nr:ribonuclease P protein component [Verrucomicrobiota bacterium]